MWKIICVSIFLMACIENNAQFSIKSDSIIITASKIPLPIKKSIKPITVISQNELQQMAGMDLSQVLNEVSGIQINGAFSNPAKDRSLYIRGANSEYTLILLDGIPIGDPSSIGAPIDLRQLSLNQFERIEILKGSHSSLYGSDAVAGVINLITKKSALKPFEMSGNIEAGSFGHLKGQFDLSGKIRILDYYFSAERSQNIGFSEALDTMESGSFDKDGFVRQSILAKINLKLVDALTISPIFRFSDYSSQYDEGAFTDGSNDFSGVFSNYGLNTQYKKGKIYSKIIYNYALSDRLFKTAFGNFQYLGKAHNVDALLNVELHPTTKLLIGIFYTNQLIDDQNAQDQIFATYAPYTNLIFSKSSFDLESSFRYNIHSAYGSNTNYSIIPSYRISEDNRIFISYNTGFKAPNISQLFGPFGPNPSLEPQISTNFEMGFEQKLNAGKINFSIHYFRRKIKNVIVYTSMYENRDLQDDNGLEIETKFQLNPKMLLSSSYTYLDGEIINTLKDPAEGMFNLYKRPKHTLKTNINYSLARKWNIYLSGQWVGKRSDVYFDLSSFTNNEVALSPYVLINTNIQYKHNKAFSTFLSVKNLTHSKYTEVYGFTTPGLHGNVGLSIRY